MSTTATTVIPITRTPVTVRKRTAGKVPSFQVVTTQVPNAHKAQVTLDYGSTPGPWISVGVNDTRVGIGYLPKRGKKK